MDEQKRDERFPGNSYNSITAKKPEEKKIAPVAKGRVQQKKRGLGEILFASDIKSVFGYIFEDILIPAAKDMLSDLVGGAVNMMLFGDRKGRRTDSRGNGSHVYTSYDRYYDRKRDDNYRPSRSRPRNVIEDVFFDSRAEADDVLNSLLDVLGEYGQVSVKDLYSFAGVSSDYTKNKYGWYNLDDADVIRVREGFTLRLPKPVVLD